MNEIGGYFGLEFDKGYNVYHNTPHMFKSGRASLHYILNVLEPSLVYIPFYTCNALIDSLEAAKRQFRFYSIDNTLEPDELPELEANEYILYVNYFDIRRKTVEKLSRMFGDRLIVDCSQAFFMKGNGKSWFFNSCRKFFGVPDGSYLYPPDTVNVKAVETRNEKYEFDYLLKRFNGRTREGYPSFLKNEAMLGTDVCGMSLLSECLLSNINYQNIINKRNANFHFLDSTYASINLLETHDQIDAPMYYPLLLPKSLDRESLYKNDIFIPMFWRDVLTRNYEGFETEKKLTENLYPLPIDHRYDREHLEKMNEVINSLL